MEGAKDAVDAFELLNRQMVPSHLPPADEGNVKKKRFQYSGKDEETIRKWFKNEIEASQLPTLGRCREFLAQHPIEDRNSQHIRDKVKTFIRQGK